MDAQQNMELLELPGWRIEYDHSATVAAHNNSPATGPELCGCDPCRNWAATRERIMPQEFRRMLAQLGIPYDREVEVYHMCRLASGLHSYGAWYHFVGRLLFGEQERSQKVKFGSFNVHFCSRPAMLAGALVGKPVVRLELDAEVPWLSTIPEAE